MKIGTSKIMRSIDKYCIEQLGIPSIVLMENASLKVVKNLDTDRYERYTIICGSGNNGGDGFVVARHLHVIGKKIQVFLVGENDKLSFDCKANYNILKNMGIEIKSVNNFDDINQLREAVLRSQVNIDCIFGTGLSRGAQDIAKSVITIINENSSYTVSIDVPSGFDCSNGQILGNCIEADKTVTFEMFKKGFLTYGAEKYTGQVVLEKIGIPENIIDRFHEDEFLVEKSYINKKIIIREKYGHKGDYGKVLIIAGSEEYTGAPYITTQSAVRAGSGLVTLCCPRSIQDVLRGKLAEAMTFSFEENEKLERILKTSNSVAIGPGIGVNEKAKEILQLVIKDAKCPLIIDADGLTLLKNNMNILNDRKAQTILTPHTGEMARLTGLSIDYINENRIEVAKKYATEWGVILLLKGYRTIITDGKKVLVNSTGNSAMATGGMGDCLTGIISSLVGQGYSCIDATFIGAYIHGFCGDELAKSMFSVSACELLNILPKCMKLILLG